MIISMAFLFLVLLARTGLKVTEQNDLVTAKQLYAHVSFSEDQWKAMQLPRTPISASGPKDWTQDAAGEAFSLFMDAMLKSEVEDVAMRKRTVEDEPMVDTDKEVWCQHRTRGAQDALLRTRMEASKGPRSPKSPQTEKRMNDYTRSDEEH